MDDFAEELQKKILEDMRKIYSEKVVELFLRPKNIERMDKPDGYGRTTGPCGDTMEIFLKITNGVIRHATFMTDGCGTTIASGSMTTELIKRKSIEEAEIFTDKDILKALGGLPDEDKHCALLAANTLRAALADYRQLKKNSWKKIIEKYKSFFK